MVKKKHHDTTSNADLQSQRVDIRSLLKDIEFLGSSHMTWKEKKELENKKVVSLGGKPPKKNRMPLSVARGAMKKQKEREQKMLEERSVLGRFGGSMFGNNTKREMKKRNPEDMVLKSSEGRFRNGVLDVKHLLQTGSSKDGVTSSHAVHKGKKKKGGKGKSGKKHGSRRGSR